jgi:hypothetical protein
MNGRSCCDDQASRRHRRRDRVDTHRDTLAAAITDPVGGVLA